MTNKPEIDYEQALKDSGMPTTEEAIHHAFAEQVSAAGLVTNTSRMSPFWRLIQATVTTPVLWLKNALVSVVMKNMFLVTADGAFLDAFAAGVSLSRKPATAARGVVRFFKENAEAEVTVPAGTVIETERLNGTVYRLMTEADHTLGAGAESALVNVSAGQTGGGSNLAPGYYRILPHAVPGIAQVTTEEGWLLTPGADAESDDELRERCRNQYNLAGNYHTDAVYRSMIAAVAGLSIDRIFFEHDAPRGPGTANAYLLLDSGVASEPFIQAVNAYITTQGHHGHGDDMRCFALPDTRHDLTVTLFVKNKTNFTPEALTTLTTGCETLIRCAFRENAAFEVKKTWPHARFSFSSLARSLHQTFGALDSVAFSLSDIVSQLDVPRLKTLTIEVKDA